MIEAASLHICTLKVRIRWLNWNNASRSNLMLTWSRPKENPRKKKISDFEWPLLIMLIPHCGVSVIKSFEITGLVINTLSLPVGVVPMPFRAQEKVYRRAVGFTLTVHAWFGGSADGHSVAVLHPPRGFRTFAMGGPRGLISLNSNLSCTQMWANKPEHGNTDTPFSSSSC